MYALTFQPWVGNAYHNGGIFGKKIMALGDSHYGTEQNANITREVLGWYLDKSVEREGWMNTYLKFERSLVGRETTAEESNDIWQSILFYNYLSTPFSFFLRGVYIPATVHFLIRLYNLTLTTRILL